MLSQHGIHRNRRLIYPLGLSVDYDGKSILSAEFGFGELNRKFYADCDGEHDRRYPYSRKNELRPEKCRAYAEHVWLFSVKPQTVLITRESSYIRKGRERRE
jgi:hypothetical protein